MLDKKDDIKKNNDKPNKTTLEALSELEELEKNPKDEDEYTSVDELINDLSK